jgi:hypothetical protein
MDPAILRRADGDRERDTDRFSARRESSVSSAKTSCRCALAYRAVLYTWRCDGTEALNVRINSSSTTGLVLPVP